MPTPTPRISGTIIQNGSTKSHISVLPDSGSVAEVIPESLASSLNLTVQKVGSEKYSLLSANGSSINVVSETVFTLEVSPSASITLAVLYLTHCLLIICLFNGGP